MGTHGPIPKRTSQRLGHLTRAEKADATVLKVSGPVKVPAADRGWHPLARSWYVSLAQSGQAQHFEPSDWQAARLVAAEMTRMLREEIPNANLFGKVWSAMGELMTTEGARRRLKVEIDRRQLVSADAPVVSLDERRAL